MYRVIAYAGDRPRFCNTYCNVGDLTSIEAAQAAAARIAELCPGKTIIIVYDRSTKK